MTRTGAADLICEPLFGADDLGALGRALAAAGLPSDDLAEPGRRFFRFRDASGAARGYAGLEDLSDCAVLLRSLVVADPARRGQGLGRRMAEAALARAGGEAWLLTMDALRRTRQFSALCPASAVLMRRPAPAS